MRKIKLTSTVVICVFAFVFAPPVIAAPIEQINCIKDEVPKEVLLEFVNSALEGKWTENSRKALNAAGVTCSERYNWTPIDEKNASRYAGASTFVDVLGQRLASHDVDVARLQAFAERGYETFKNGGLEALGIDAVFEAVEEAGGNTSDSSMMADGAMYINFYLVEKSLSEDFEAGVLSK